MIDWSTDERMDRYTNNSWLVIDIDIDRQIDRWSDLAGQNKDRRCGR